MAPNLYPSLGHTGKYENSLRERERVDFFEKKCETALFVLPLPQTERSPSENHPHNVSVRVLVCVHVHVCACVCMYVRGTSPHVLLPSGLNVLSC